MRAPIFSDAQLAPDGTARICEASGTGDVLAWWTDDLGRTFRPLLRTPLVGSGTQLYGIFFLSREHGFVCGETGDGRPLALTTRDGGLTWASLESLLEAARGASLTQILFLDDEVGFAVSPGEALWRSTDGGRSWARIAPDGLEAFGAFFLDGTPHGWILSQTVTPEWKILRTEHFETRDAGSSFQALGDTLDGVPSRIDVAACGFWNPRIGILCGPDGKIARTEDGARTWRRVASGTDRDLNFLALATPSTAWAAGADGVLLRTADAGSTWERLETDTPEQLHAAVLPDAAHGFVAGESGTALWTDDGGRTFRRSRFER